MDCIFCKIIKKEISAEIIYEDDGALSILDVYPVAPGHAMVLPKAHAQNILEVRSDQLGHLFSAVQAVTNILMKALQPDGFTIGINHGKVSGQTVDHLHIHIIPRWSTDHGGSLHSVVHNPPKESVQEIALRITNNE